MLDDLLWALRREGFAISTAQAIDAARAVREVGFDRGSVREAIACVVVDSIERRGPYDRIFDDFFSPRAARPADLRARLVGRGFTEAELDSLRKLLGELFAPEETQLGALFAGGSRLDHLLASQEVQALLGRMNGPMQKGYYTHRVLEGVGVERARAAL